MKSGGRCQYREPHRARCRRIATALAAESDFHRSTRLCFRHYLPVLLRRKQRMEWNDLRRRLFGDLCKSQIHYLNVRHL